MRSSCRGAKGGEEVISSPPLCIYRGALPGQRIKCAIMESDEFGNIPNPAFRRNAQLPSITLPPGIISIGEEASSRDGHFTVHAVRNSYAFAILLTKGVRLYCM